jgi:hypothetical protein
MPDCYGGEREDDRSLGGEAAKSGRKMVTFNLLKPSGNLRPV